MKVMLGRGMGQQWFKPPGRFAGGGKRVFTREHLRDLLCTKLRYLSRIPSERRIESLTTLTEKLMSEGDFEGLVKVGRRLSRLIPLLPPRHPRKAPLALYIQTLLLRGMLVAGAGLLREDRLSLATPSSLRQIVEALHKPIPRCIQGLARLEVKRPQVAYYLDVLRRVQRLYMGIASPEAQESFHRLRLRLESLKLPKGHEELWEIESYIIEEEYPLFSQVRKVLRRMGEGEVGEEVFPQERIYLQKLALKLQGMWGKFLNILPQLKKEAPEVLKEGVSLKDLREWKREREEQRETQIDELVQRILNPREGKAVEEAITYFNRPSPEVRELSLKLLQTYYQKLEMWINRRMVHRRIESLFREIFTHGDPSLQLQIVDSLKEGGTKSVPFLIQALKSPLDVVKCRTVGHLEDIGPLAVNPLNKILKEELEEKELDELTLRRIVEALGRIGDSRSIKILKGIRSHPRWREISSDIKVERSSALKRNRTRGNSLS